MKKTASLAFCILIFGALVAFSQTTLIAKGSSWKYLDNGSNQGTQWTQVAFDDSLWASGNAQLGYGDGDEITVLNYGPDSANKYITTYFRKSFNVTDTSAFTGLTLNILRDDGAVVFLNGTEIYRTNMPDGTVTHQTLATTAIGGADESTFITTNLPLTNLVSGNNVIAVEVHQNAANSTDLSLDVELIGQTSVLVTRGPYLQMGTPSAMTMRWRTNAPTNSRVSYGTTQGALSMSADDATVTTEHEVRLTGLTANTKYFYSIGSSSETLAGNDANHFFYTAPQEGASGSYRVWVLGDSGTSDANARAVRDSYAAFNAGRYTNLMLMLGDNAYNTGTDSEYQTAVYEMYPANLRQTPLWPTIGNHDTAQATSVPSTLPYFQMFSLPTNAEAGGLPSGTEKYYSFNYGNIHFVCLDSMTSSRAPGSAMLTWLENDLSMNTKPWVIAFWHHPPYTKGSHDSDTESELIEMRSNVLPILESYGVDLVLTGHSHSYERSFLIDGHYGLSTTFTNTMKKNPGGGREDSAEGPYRKSILNSYVPHEGAVYAVAGSSGKISGGTLNHPAMFVSLNNLGSMVLDVNNDRLDAKFIRENGEIADYFTIIKGLPAQTSSPKAPTGLTVTSVGKNSISLRWTDNSTDEAGFEIQRCTGTACTTFAKVGESGANVATFTNGLLLANTTYSYRVRAFNSAGSSGFTRTMQTKTKR